ncbi:hypothetical protein ACFPRL_25740 [Pseudoclavibacter helvolus]
MAAIMSVAVVLCAPPLGFMTTTVRDPSNWRCTRRISSRLTRSASPGPSLMSPPVPKRRALRQPCCAGASGAACLSASKSASVGAEVSLLRRSGAVVEAARATDADAATGAVFVGCGGRPGRMMSRGPVSTFSISSSSR